MKRDKRMRRDERMSKGWKGWGRNERLKRDERVEDGDERMKRDEMVGEGMKGWRAMKEWGGIKGWVGMEEKKVTISTLCMECERRAVSRIENRKNKEGKV